MCVCVCVCGLRVCGLKKIVAHAYAHALLRPRPTGRQVPARGGIHGVKEALHERARRGVPQALREREAN